jgi:hypothetical protein
MNTLKTFLINDEQIDVFDLFLSRIQELNLSLKVENFITLFKFYEFKTSCDLIMSMYLNDMISFCIMFIISSSHQIFQKI